MNYVGNSHRKRRRLNSIEGYYSEDYFCTHSIMKQLERKEGLPKRIWHRNLE